MTHWLLVERLENWVVDKNEGFRRYGLSTRKQRLADQMQKGDVLIFYVSSGLSQFADIREVSKDGTFTLGADGPYDTAFPLFIATKPRLTLARESWVPIQELLPKLSITANKNWRQAMRTSLRRISDEDAGVIVAAMKKAATRR